MRRVVHATRSVTARRLRLIPFDAAATIHVARASPKPTLASGFEAPAPERNKRRRAAREHSTLRMLVNGETALCGFERIGHVKFLSGPIVARTPYLSAARLRAVLKRDQTAAILNAAGPEKDCAHA